MSFLLFFVLLAILYGLHHIFMGAIFDVRVPKRRK